MRYGCFESNYYDSDFIHIDAQMELPESYEVKNQYDVLNQGNEGSCVSCALIEAYHFHQLSHNKKLDLPWYYFYENRKDKSKDGMSIREAFEMLINENRIVMFSRLASLDYLKKSILLNGPAVIGLIAKSESTEFWKGNQVLGGHAVAVVGYDEYGLKIKNSWGMSYGYGGYATLSYSDFSLVKEAWSIFS